MQIISDKLDNFSFGHLYACIVLIFVQQKVGGLCSHVYITAYKHRNHHNHQDSSRHDTPE